MTTEHSSTLADTRTYDHAAVEKRWQAAWQAAGCFAVDTDDTSSDQGEPFYVLEMFPYPSGALHMGHVRNYAIGDVFARYQWMQGKRVLHPMGWDSLGLPAENQAIKENIAPQIRTPKNIEQMKEQFQLLGLAYDWDREIATYKPEYYKWNQWFFTRFLAQGWVYRRQAEVNWCPGCATVLANEQVTEVDGESVCWREHRGVSKRLIPEWAFRTTAFAEELLAGLDELAAWPDKVVSQQRNWLGKSVGAEVSFPLQDHAAGSSIDVFTTRVDTIFGCTYVVLAPEHELTDRVTTAEQRGDVEAFVQAQRKVDRIKRTAVGGAKEGVFTGAFALNPYTNERVPVWLANFVLADYGTGAVMSVPAHDQRDFEFAQQYDLPIKPVIAPAHGPSLGEPLQSAYAGDGILFNSGAYDGLSSAAARDTLADRAKTGGFGDKAISWHLRDWGFSRQRYWGTPIPVVYCDKDGVVPVPDEQLPVVLPDFDSIKLTGSGGSPLAQLESFTATTCPKCGGPATRETETMDTFVDSAWYFARFLSPHDAERPFSVEAAKAWLPVDVYVGGPEHAVMHLLYFRFWTKAMRELGLVDIEEPVTRLITQGMVNALAFKCEQHGFVPAADMRDRPAVEQVCPTCATPLQQATVKMGKSKLNGVDPLNLIDKYGADTARLYSLFAAPPQKDLEWNQDSVEGIYRFIGRLYRVCEAQQGRLQNVDPSSSMVDLQGSDKTIRQAVHKALAKVTAEIGERIHFNTAIAALMELSNTMHAHKLHQEDSPVAAAVAKETLLLLAQMLSPLAPHLAEEIWLRSGGTGLVAQSRWPRVDEEALVQDSVQIAVQVNGKLRAQLNISPEQEKEDVLRAAKAEANVQKFIEGKRLVKEIYVPGRLVSLVAK